MAQVIHRSHSTELPPVSQESPVEVAANTEDESWLSSRLSALSSLTSSLSDWAHTTGKRYLQTTTNGLWVASEAKRYQYDVGERDEAFFADPEGPAYQFVDDLSKAPEESIRLLEVLKGERDDDVVCRLHTVPLSDHPPYEALSYYWGSDEPVYPVGIQSEDAARVPDDANISEDDVPWHDYTFNLQPNIRSALRHVRLPDRSRLVWADAICIDQKNLDERNHQVALMHKVYSKAERTLIWIGKSGFGSDLVFKELRRVADDDKNGRIPDSTDVPVFGENQLSGSPAVVRLIDRDWFHRLWTVQEVLLAKDADILCGWESMSWRDFVRSIHILYDRDLAPGRRMSLLDQGRFDSFLVLTSGGLEMSRESNHDPYQRLTNLLLALRPRDSSVPSDKVYGLSGLVCSRDSKQIIKTDYHKSYDEVYAMATRLAIENTKSLDILGASGSTLLLNQSAEPVPSWVGDFVHRRRPPRPFRFTHEAAIRPGRTDLAADPDDIRFDGDKLFLQGCVVDEIASIAPVLEDFDLTEMKKRMDDGVARAEQIERDMKDALSMVNDPDKPANVTTKVRTKIVNLTQGLKVANAIGSANADANNIEIRSMFSWHLQSVQTFLDWEALAGIEVSAEDSDADGDSDSDSDDSTSESIQQRTSPRWDEYWRTIAGGNLLSDDVEASRKAFGRFYDILAATRSLRRRGVSNEKKFDRLLNLAGYLAGQYSAGSEFPKLLAHAQGRRLARTKSDRLVLVAEDGKTGDHLAFCKGGRVPFLLRRQEGGWRFVGEAYCHDLAEASLEHMEWEDISIL